MGHVPNFTGLSIDREATGTPTEGWRYMRGRGSGTAYHKASPWVSSKADVDDIRAAAATSPSAWASILSTDHATVWNWLQAEASDYASEVGGGLTQAAVLEIVRALDAREA